MNTLMNTDMNTTLEEMYFSFEEISDFVEEYSTDEEDAEYARLKEELDEGMLALESLLEYKGISRSMAVTFEQYIPAGYPLNSFSRLPSQTNYRPVVASLEEANWGIIGVIVVAIVAAITKLIMWFFDRKKKRDMGDVKKDLKKINEVIVALKSTHDKNGEVLKKYIEEQGEKWTDLHEAFINASATNNLYIKDLFSSTRSVYIELVGSLQKFINNLRIILSGGDNDVEGFKAQMDKNYERFQETLKSITNGFHYAYDTKNTDSVEKFIEISQEITKLIEEKVKDKRKITEGAIKDYLNVDLSVTVVFGLDNIGKGKDSIDSTTKDVLTNAKKSLEELNAELNTSKADTKSLKYVKEYVNIITKVEGAYSKYLSCRSKIEDIAMQVRNFYAGYANALKKAKGEVEQETSKP